MDGLKACGIELDLEVKVGKVSDPGFVLSTFE